MKNILQLFLGITFVVISCYGNKTFEYFKEKPPFLPSCAIYQPHFSVCSRYNVQKYFNQLIIGIPELSNEIGSLEPIYLEHLDFNLDNDLAKVSGNFSDIYIRGLSNVTIKSSDVSTNDFTWITVMKLPRLAIEYKYDVSGVINGKAVEHKTGHTLINLEHLEIEMIVTGHLYEKDDITFHNPEEVRLSLKPRLVRTNIPDLLNPDTYDVSSPNETPFDMNPNVFDRVFRPYFNKGLEKLFLKALQVSFRVLPAKYFISDIPTSKQLYGTVKPNVQPASVD